MRQPNHFYISNTINEIPNVSPTQEWISYLFKRPLFLPPGVPIPSPRKKTASAGSTFL